MPTATITFTGHGSGWNSISGDDGVYALDDAWLAVFGDNALVTLTGGDSRVSFNGPSSGVYHEVVDGDDGIVIGVHADIALTGDNDIVFFDPGAYVLDLSVATAGAWSALYASGAFVNLHGASLSIFGGGVTVNAASGDDAVSLYKTNGVADTVSGDDMTVSLISAQAVVNGNSDRIWLVGGSASTVTINSAAAQADRVFGPGTIDVASGGVVSVGGGALINFEAPGEVAYVSYTQGVWDRVQGAAATIYAYSAQVVGYGGGQIIRFDGGEDNAASLYQTNGNWDSVYGAARTLSVTSAQVNDYGAINDIYLSGAGTKLSIYYIPLSTFVDNNVHGSNATIDVNSVFNVNVIGGGDKLFLTNAYNGNGVTLTGTAGAWDTVYGQNHYIVLQGAQASVIGGGNTIYSGRGDNAVSLYSTGGNYDNVYDGGGAVMLTDAQATASGSAYYFYFGGAANTLALYEYGSGDVLTFVGAFGLDTVSGFTASDTIQLSKSQFADFQAFQSAFTQVGTDAVLTLDANDKVTFGNLNVASVTATQVSFV